MHPLEAVLSEGERRPDGRRHAERVDGRADVVDEAGQGQLGRADPTTGLLGPFEDDDRATGTGQRDRRRQPVGPGADDDRIDGSRRDDLSPLPDGGRC
jgi:hypothetical protein